MTKPPKSQLKNKPKKQPKSQPKKQPKSPPQSKNKNPKARTPHKRTTQASKTPNRRLQATNRRKIFDSQIIAIIKITNYFD